MSHEILNMVMPDARFTRGPWQRNSRDPLQVCDCDGEVRGCAPIARVAGSGVEARANAALIATAPELHDTLVDLLGCVPAAYGESIDRAIAVLVKARTAEAKS